MTRSHPSVPKLIEFERETAASESSTKSPEESQDELQALNTALCFLCSINADAKEVDAFLTLHPEALLLEGTGNLSEESAHFIVEEQMRRCECFSPVCRQNRLNVLAALDQGFEHYQEKKLFATNKRDSNYHDKEDDQEGSRSPFWERTASAELIAVERDIRQWRHAELQMRNKLLETAVDVRAHLEELEEVEQCYHQHHQKAGGSGNGYKSVLASLLASSFSCTMSSTRNGGGNDKFARRSVLEYQVGVASLNLVSVEREHKVLLREIRHGRRTQFALLKGAFDGVRRHVCTVTKPKHSDNKN